MTKRSSGVLMHITSLPGEFGIGTFGKSAYDFVDFLEETKQTYWQILPLTTTSYGDSPYQSFSAVAGNLNLIDFSLLKEEGLLEESDYSNVNFGENPEKIDYALLFEVRRPILEKAVANTAKYSNVLAEIEEFEKDNSSWLADYAEYMAIKESFGYQSFIHWDEDIKKGEKAAREKYRTELQDSIRYYTVTQYFFFKQWLALKEYANGKGVKIIGDMPIYVSADSVEVWTMPELFKVDDNNEPLYVAGCPADDFSPTGQLWGNPIYDWEKHKEQGFSWWIYRVQESFKIYDVLRIDHFKGFSDFWQIDKDAENAVNGTWEAGPGIAFPGDDNLDRPHHYTQNSVAYTGTHDNDVVNGWYEKLSESEQELVSEYLNRRNDETITEAMIRGIYSSVSDYAIVTMQDLLDKDATSRMNVPSTVGGNWEWRMLAEDLTEERKEFLKNITVRYSRERA